MSRYHQTYAAWKNDPETFWADAAKDIDWSRQWDAVLDTSQSPSGRWFVGARCNTCFNCIDRHVNNGRGDKTAIIHDSPVTDSITTFTYNELLEKVSVFAGVLTRQGIGAGDRVILYMPMIPEAAIAMLACARIGAIHSVVFGGFAARELAIRIDDARPKAVVSASCGIEPGRIVAYKPLLDEALETAAHKPDVCIVLQRPMQEAALTPGRDLDWSEEYAAALKAGEKPACVDVAATDPLYILYTSGTTGKPKGVVRDNGGHMVALKWSMDNIYGLSPDDIFWTASDVGWVVGHSYIVYGPLLHGCTTILYEGKPVGTPDAGAFWRVISQHGARALFTAPTAFRAIRKEDPDAKLLGRYDLSRFKALFLAGERADSDTIQWAERHLNVPVIDHWWQTETGWAIAANPSGLGLLPVKYGSPTVPMPGWDVRILGEDGKPVPPETLGAIVVKLPLPPSSMPTLWNNEQGFRETYFSAFPGCYETADAGYIDADGYVYIMARTDDIISVAGHRLSTGGMEEVLACHPDVAECAVIGAADALKGQAPVGFLVLNAGVDRDPADVSKEAVALVREKIGPVAAFKTALVVGGLPKTRSGKILRGTMRKIADGNPWTMPATIDTPATLEDIAAALRKAGYAGKSAESS